LLPVGNGQAACGLRAVFAGAAGAAAADPPADEDDDFFAELLRAERLPPVEPFFAERLAPVELFLAALRAPPFDFLAADFFAPVERLVFFALDLRAPDFLAPVDFLALERFAAVFFAPVFRAPVFFAPARLAPVDFLALFLAPIDFLAPVDLFAPVDFLAAFFAVAITFLLDQVDMEPPADDVSSAGGYSSPDGCPGGAPRSDESGLQAGSAHGRGSCPANLDLSLADAMHRDGFYSHDSAPPVW
jgi:hypothetical protein